MASWDDVRRLSLALPETTETTSRGQAQWKVGTKTFVWMRPLRKADQEALGGKAPAGPILGARTDGIVAKEALLASGDDAFFTTPHFDGYPAILIQLDVIDLDELEEVITEAWAVQAPRRLVKDYFDSRGE
jgi:hypothetical protein